MAKHTLEYGDRCIIMFSDRYKNKNQGLLCTVRRTGYDTIAVEVDSKPNNHSSYAYYYYPEKHLQFIEGDKIAMSNVIKGKYETVIVQFTNSTNNIACANFGNDNLVIGDFVVVKTARHGFAVCEVTATDVETVPCEREIVCKVNMDMYFKRVKQRERAVELKKKLDERTAELQQLQIYEMLAKGDDSLSALLSEFKELMDLC